MCNEAGLTSWNFLVYVFRGLGTVVVVSCGYTVPNTVPNTVPKVLYLILGHAIMTPNSIVV